jgi:hypothetical protein
MSINRHHVSGMVNLGTIQQRQQKANNMVLANSDYQKSQRNYAAAKAQKQAVKQVVAPIIFYAPPPAPVKRVQPPVIVQVPVPVPVPQTPSVTPEQLKQSTDNTNAEIQKLSERVNELTVKLASETAEKVKLNELLEKDRENLARIHGMLEEVCSIPEQPKQSTELQNKLN